MTTIDFFRGEHLFVYSDRVMYHTANAAVQQNWCTLQGAPVFYFVFRSHNGSLCNSCYPCIVGLSFSLRRKIELRGEGPQMLFLCLPLIMHGGLITQISSSKSRILVRGPVFPSGATVSSPPPPPSIGLLFPLLTAIFGAVKPRQILVQPSWLREKCHCCRKYSTIG